jgi:8-oxo-dGTP diphosphatase
MDTVKVGVGVLIEKDGKILLGKRISSHGSGTYNLPGGHIEFGETIAECAKREVKEETGLDVEMVKLISVSNDIMYGKHYVTLGVLAKLVSGKPSVKEPEKFVDLKWYDYGNLPSPLFIASERIINNFLNNSIFSDSR